MTPEDQQQRVEELASKLPSAVRLFARRELKSLQGVLHPDEEPLLLVQGRYLERQGLLAVTDRRLIFLEAGMVRKRQEDFAYGKITTVAADRGLAFGKLVIHAGSHTAEIDQVVPKELAHEAAEIVRKHLSVTAAAASADTGRATDPVERLQKLAELHKAGALSDEEFEQAKAKLLGGL